MKVVLVVILGIVLICGIIGATVGFVQSFKEYKKDEKGQ